MPHELRLQTLRDAVMRAGRHAVEYGNGAASDTPDARTITLNTYRPAHATADSPSNTPAAHSARRTPLRRGGAVVKSVVVSDIRHSKETIHFYYPTPAQAHKLAYTRVDCRIAA